MSIPARPAPELTDDTPLVEFTSSGNVPLGRPRTAREILHWMTTRRKYLGTPLPDGYIPPPGIDIGELLKQLPPLPPPTV